jgi:hypothetical protein
VCGYDFPENREWPPGQYCLIFCQTLLYEFHTRKIRAAGLFKGRCDRCYRGNRIVFIVFFRFFAVIA